MQLYHLSYINKPNNHSLYSPTYTAPAALPADAVPVPVPTFLPFNAGNPKALLVPTSPFVLIAPPVCGAHHSAPTHGCTFHPTESVTFSRSAIFPETSPMEYFAR